MAGLVADECAAAAQEGAERVEGVVWPQSADLLVVGPAGQTQPAVPVDRAEVGGAHARSGQGLAGVEGNPGDWAGQLDDRLAVAGGDGRMNAGDRGADRAEGLEGGFGVEVGE